LSLRHQYVPLRNLQRLQMRFFESSGDAVRLVLIFCVLWPCVVSTALADERVIWTGQGRWRILVEVPPRDLAGRTLDEMPAEVELDFLALLRKQSADRLPDLGTLQVIRYDAMTGQPIANAKLTELHPHYERPFRWYDDAIAYDFPEVTGDVVRNKGTLPRKSIVRGGHFYNALGDWKAGRLAWLHTQNDQQTSHYAIYFDLLPAGELPAGPAPRGWVGDGLPRCDRLGSSSFGADHARIDLDDWNDDGLVDLIVGESYGHVFWWPNRGTRQKPHFPYPKFVFDKDGLPLDAGMASAPKVVDWDDDGVKDLLVGTEWNRILFFRNTGTNRERRLKYEGQLESDGEVLQLPIAPLERGSPDIFKRDYYPVLETVDWDHDGDVDLLAGGYITGRVYFYENVTQTSEGHPQLELRGPLLADGSPLNVGHWCAAPCVADFDADGDLDLISGNMPVGRSGGDNEGSGDFLVYFENVGTPRSAELRPRRLARTGDFPRARLATPRATDWDGDGDLDLIVSARENLYLYENTGSVSVPEFSVHAQPVQTEWGAAGIAARQFLDWNGDSRLDIVNGYTVRLNAGGPNPWSWRESVSVLPGGVHIAHPSGIGDDWHWPFIDDFDQDGRYDVLFGDWFGHVWFHRNLSTDSQKRFDVEGYKLTLASGEPIKVGPINKDIQTDFAALQGARTVFTVDDFDRDGHRDLVVGDTYGIVRFFRNTGAARQRFETPAELGNLGIRLLVDATDWNGDGWPDVIAGAASGRVRVFLNSGQSAGPRFETGFDPGLPPIPQPRVLMADLNGDGDEDLYLPSTMGSCFIERSFLNDGYARGQVTRLEERPR